MRAGHDHAVRWCREHLFSLFRSTTLYSHINAFTSFAFFLLSSPRGKLHLETRPGMFNGNGKEEKRRSIIYCRVTSNVIRGVWVLGASVLKSHTRTHTRTPMRTHTAEGGREDTIFTQRCDTNTDRRHGWNVCVCRSPVNTFSSPGHTQWWEGPGNAGMTHQPGCGTTYSLNINFWKYQSSKYPVSRGTDIIHTDTLQSRNQINLLLHELQALFYSVGSQNEQQVTNDKITLKSTWNVFEWYSISMIKFLVFNFASVKTPENCKEIGDKTESYMWSKVSSAEVSCPEGGISVLHITNCWFSDAWQLRVQAWTAVCDEPTTCLRCDHTPLVHKQLWSGPAASLRPWV